MAENPQSAAEHFDAEKQPKSEPRTNPLAGSLNVTVSVPETITIRMVDASVLADYEVWFFISSIIGSALVGFLVAFIQDITKLHLLAMTAIWGVLFVVALWMTFSKRGELQKKSKEIKLRAFEIETDDSAK